MKKNSKKDKKILWKGKKYCKRRKFTAKRKENYREMEKKILQKGKKYSGKEKKILEI